MDWEGYAAAGLSKAFGIDPGTAAAGINAAKYATNLANQYRRKGGPMEPPAKARRVGGVSNVRSNGHYLGPFWKRRISTRETTKTRHGFIQEQEVYGQITANDIQYVGFQSVTPTMVIPAIATALIRMIFWRHYRVVYPSVSDFVYPASTITPDLSRIDWITRSKRSDGTWTETYHTGVTIVSGSTTLQALVDNLVTYMSTNDFGFKQVVDDTRFAGYRFIYPRVTTFNYSPDYSLEEQYVRLSVMNVIQLQNTTRADSTLHDSTFSRDRIDANPLYGSVFTMRGLYPDIEGLYDVDTSSWVKELQTENGISLQYGLIIPDTQPQGSFRAIPNPQIFADVIKAESGLRLEPGDIKKDVLRFSFNGKLRDLIEGLAYFNALGQASNVSGYRKRRFGVVKLFAFEKVVPTGSARVEMNYHVDRFVNCVFREDFQTPSIRKDYLPLPYSRILTATVARDENALKRIREDDPSVIAINDEGDEIYDD